MISYHPIKPGSCNNPQQYYRNFIAVETDDVRRIGICVKNYCWSPVEYSGGLRRKANFVKANWLALDFDNGEMSIEDAINTFCDMICIIGTTKSHSPDLHRFRVILRMERPCTNYLEYEYNLKKITSLYPCDPAPKDAARFFWPCKDIVYSQNDGFCVDVYEKPENYGVFDCSKTISYGNSLVIPPKARQILNSKLYETGNRNSQIFKCSCIMIRAGFSVEKIEQIIIQSKCCNLELNEINTVVGKAFKTVTKG